LAGDAAGDIAAWLGGLGLERYVQTFRDHEIDTEVLPELTDVDLEKLGVPLGHRKKLLRAIAGLTAAEAELRAAPGSISTASRAPEAERRQLTVMFVDLVGSTELAARLDPEDMAAVIRAYHKACTEVVERWGGHVAKYMGDGVLAYLAGRRRTRMRPSGRSGRVWSWSGRCGASTRRGRTWAAGARNGSGSRPGSASRRAS
jgi:SAM domain (Sterile alpha motif)/Adenylate and Guanylate cyclase catalytic domain